MEKFKITKHRHRWVLLADEYNGFTNEDGDSLINTKWCSVCGGVKVELENDNGVFQQGKIKYPFWLKQKRWPMAEENADVFKLVNTTALDALVDGAAAVAMHGLKNELNRLHELHKMAALPPLEYNHIGLDRSEIWTRIIVIQEALLDVARMLVKKG